MYYPYLRGKQFELILLRENTHLFKKEDKHRMHPIIEPVREDMTALNRTLDKLNEEKVSYTLIVNPKVGKLKDQQINKDDVRIDKSLTYIGYILDAKADLSNLSSVLEEYEDHSISLIHYGFTDGKQLVELLNNFQNIKNHIFIDLFAGKLYQRPFKNDGIKKVLIRDGFKQQKKNILYPRSEHFSDLHITFED